MNIVIANTTRALIELPPILPVLAKGTEVVTPAVLDVDGRLVTPAVLMDAGAVIAEGYHEQKLAPGQSDVDGDYWDKLRERRPIKALLAVGSLVNKGEGKAEALVATLDSLTTAQAKEAIASCTNMGVLDVWVEETENAGLHKLIGLRKAQIIEQQSGRPVQGANTPDFDGGTFGDSTTRTQAQGDGAPAFGDGEQARAAAPAPAPTPAPAPSPSPAPAPAPAEED